MYFYNIIIFLFLCTVSIKQNNIISNGEEDCI